MRISKAYGSMELCQAVLTEINSYFGYPKKGTNCGSGPFVHIPDEYFPGAPGWTSDYTYYIVINEQYHVVLDDVLESLNGSVFDFGTVTNYSINEEPINIEELV